MSEPWLDKRELATYLSCSPKSIQRAVAEGMPHAILFGKIKCRISEVEPWLQSHGHLELAGDRTTICADPQKDGPVAPRR
jgi:hypothetical protein